jgi:hypothetical protein
MKCNSQEKYGLEKKMKVIVLCALEQKHKRKKATAGNTRNWKEKVWDANTKIAR